MNSFKRSYSKDLPFIRKSINTSASELSIRFPHRPDPVAAEVILPAGTCILSLQRSDRETSCIPPKPGWHHLPFSLSLFCPSHDTAKQALQRGRTPMQMNCWVAVGQTSHADKREYQGQPPDTFPQQLRFFISKNFDCTSSCF